MKTKERDAKANGDRWEENILATIERSGHAVIGGTHTTIEGAYLSYSAGLADKGYPEVLMCYVPQGIYGPILIGTIINKAINLLKEKLGDLSQATALELPEYLELPPVRLKVRLVDTNQAVVAGANFIGKRYFGKPVRICQVLLPSSTGVFPDEEPDDIGVIPCEQILIPSEPLAEGAGEGTTVH